MRSVLKLLTAVVVVTGMSAPSASASSAGWSRFCVLKRQQADALIGHIVAREGNATEHDCSYIGDPYGLNMSETAASGSTTQSSVSRPSAHTKVTILHGIGRDATLSTRALSRTPGVGAEVGFTVGATRYELGLTVTRTALSSKQVRLLVKDAKALATKLE